MGRILFGFLVGIVVLPLCVAIWFYNGKVPVAVTDPPFPLEEQITQVPMHQRIDKEMIQIPPLQPDEANLVAGAKIYAEKCAVCHGFHGKPSVLGQSMFPAAPPLWEKHHSSSIVGVSDDPSGETYWKVANGIRLTGMPEFRSELSNDQMWQVSLLLANADKPLPPGALSILKTGIVPETGTGATGQATDDSSPKVSSDSQ